MKCNLFDEIKRIHRLTKDIKENISNKSLVPCITDSKSINQVQNCVVNKRLQMLYLNNKITDLENSPCLQNIVSNESINYDNKQGLSCLLNASNQNKVYSCFSRHNNSFTTRNSNQNGKGKGKGGNFKDKIQQHKKKIKKKDNEIRRLKNVIKRLKKKKDADTIIIPTMTGATSFQPSDLAGKTGLHSFQDLGMIGQSDSQTQLQTPDQGLEQISNQIPQ